MGNPLHLSIVKAGKKVKVEDRGRRNAMQDVNDGLNLDRTTYCSIQDILQYYTIYNNITYLEPCPANTPELLNLPLHHLN